MLRLARLALPLCVGIILFAVANTSSADTIHVDSCSTSSSDDGSERRPFRTLEKAVAEADQGDTINVRRGSYPVLHSEHFVVDTPVTITAVDGPASIGQYGNLVRTVRVLTHNIAALDIERLDESCENRTERFGLMVANNGIAPEEPTSPGGSPPDYDIVGVQEYWRDVSEPFFDSCDNAPLFEGITSVPVVSGITPTRKYLDDEGVVRRYLFKPDEASLDFFFFDADGGLGTFTIHNINKKSSHSWDVRDFPSCVRQGFTFTRINISADLELDVYNVHLCGETDPVSRAAELQQLAKNISDKSSTSGNPVLVMGDFNIKSEEYESIIQELKSPRDVWLEARADEEPTNPGLTHKGERIDYIFLLTDPQFVNTRFVLQPTNAQVVQWTMPNPDDPISDHFGVEVSINIHNCR